MADLIEFLTARLDEDEQAALLALKGYDHPGDPGDMPDERRRSRWRSDYEHVTVLFPDGKQEPLVTAYRANYPAAHHIARHDPARVLREVEAKRKIVDRYAADLKWYEATKNTTALIDLTGQQRQLDALLFAVKCLALSYSDHPAYRMEWKP